MRMRKGLVTATGVATSALMAPVWVSANPFNAELLRRACNDYVAAHAAQETIEGLKEWKDPKKVPSLQDILGRVQSRLGKAEQQVINHLPEEDIGQLRAIADMQRAIRTVREDADWPVFGDVRKLLGEIYSKAQDTREAALVHFCRRR